MRVKRGEIEGIQVVLGLQRKFFVQFVLVPHQYYLHRKKEKVKGAVEVVKRLDAWKSPFEMILTVGIGNQPIIYLCQKKSSVISNRWICLLIYKNR